MYLLPTQRVPDWYYLSVHCSLRDSKAQFLLHLCLLSPFPQFLSSFSSTSVLPFFLDVPLLSGYVCPIGWLCSKPYTLSPEVHLVFSRRDSKTWRPSRIC